MLHLAKISETNVDVGMMMVDVDREVDEKWKRMRKLRQRWSLRRRRRWRKKHRDMAEVRDRVEGEMNVAVREWRIGCVRDRTKPLSNHTESRRAGEPASEPESWRARPRASRRAAAGVPKPRNGEGQEGWGPEGGASKGAQKGSIPKREGLKFRNRHIRAHPHTTGLHRHPHTKRSILWLKEFDLYLWEGPWDSQVVAGSGIVSSSSSLSSQNVSKTKRTKKAPSPKHKQCLPFCPRSRNNDTKPPSKNTGVWFEIDLFACVNPFVPKPSGQSPWQLTVPTMMATVAVYRDCCDRSLSTCPPCVSAEREIARDVKEKLCYIGVDYDSELKSTDKEKIWRAPRREHHHCRWQVVARRYFSSQVSLAKEPADSSTPLSKTLWSATFTSAKSCTPLSWCQVARPFPKGSLSTWRRNWRRNRFRSWKRWFKFQTTVWQKRMKSLFKKNLKLGTHNILKFFLCLSLFDYQYCSFFLLLFLFSCSVFVHCRDTRLVAPTIKFPHQKSSISSTIRLQRFSRLYSSFFSPFPFWFVFLSFCSSFFCCCYINCCLCFFFFFFNWRQFWSWEIIWTIFDKQRVIWDTFYILYVISVTLQLKKKIEPLVVWQSEMTHPLLGLQSRFTSLSSGKSQVNYCWSGPSDFNRFPCGRTDITTYHAGRHNYNSNSLETKTCNYNCNVILIPSPGDKNLYLWL